MKKTYLPTYLRINFILMFSIFNFLNVNYGQNRDCFNGGFENGNFSHWQGKYGHRNFWGINLNSLQNGIDPGHFMITNAGFDQNVGGNLLSLVGEGVHSVRLGDATGSNKQSSVLYYKFLVTNNNKDFGFKYAMVMEDGAHGSHTNPFFGYRIYRDTWNWWGGFGTSTIKASKIVADISNPYFNKNGPYVWKDWTSECVDLSSYVGQYVTLMVYVADCNQGGHAGYAYVDGLCSNNEASSSFSMPAQICQSDVLFADGSNSNNELSHFWSIQESDANWNLTGTEYSQWYVASQAGAFNLSDFIDSKGGQLKCNTYYRVKLAVSNNCTQWKESSQLVYIKCPKINEIDDYVYCCGAKPGMIYLNPFGKPKPFTQFPYEVSWNIDPPTTFSSLADGSGIAFSPFQNTTVEYTVTDADGCVVTKDVNFWFIDDFDISITSEKVGCCKEKLTVNFEFEDLCNTFSDLSKEDQATLLNLMNFQWNTGETGESIIVQYADSIVISVNVSIGSCYSHDAFYTYHPPFDKYTATAYYTRPCIAPNAFTPNGDGINDVFQVLEFGLNAPLLGEPYAYGIIAYQFTVWDRWGLIQYFYDSEVELIGECNFSQGDIQWDGNDSNGNPLPLGVYLYSIMVKTCNGDGTWHQICAITNGIDPETQTNGPVYNDYTLCKSWHWVWSWGLPPVKKVCDDWWHLEDLQIPIGFQHPSSNICPYSIRLIR